VLINILKYCFLLIIGALMIGCSNTSKITGKRELFLPLPNNVALSQNLAEKQVKIPFTDVKEWLQDGFSSKNEGINANFNVLDAKLLWESRIGKTGKSYNRLLTNIVINNKVLFAGDATGNVIAVDLNAHKILWRVDISKGIDNIVKIGGLAIVNNNDLLVSTAKGDIHKIDAKTGSIKKTKSIGGVIRSAPCVFQKKIIVQTANNSLVVLNDDLKIHWKQNEIPEEVIFIGNSSPATDGNTIISAYSSGEYKAYDFLSGNEIWADLMVPSIQNETIATMLHICAAPVITGNLVLIFGHGGKLTANNLTSSERVWSLDISGMSTPIAAGDWIFAIDEESRVFCIEKATGNIKWQSNIPEDKKGKIAVSWTKPILAGNALITVTNNGEIVFFDINTGKILKIIQSKAIDPSSAIVVNEVLYILCANGKIYAFG
jgi:outer membrane protein assembly factor BamB